MVWSAAERASHLVVVRSTVIMACIPYRRRVITTYVLHMMARHLCLPPKSLEEHVRTLQLDITILLFLIQTRYLRDRSRVLKAGNLHLAWEYAQDPSAYNRFVSMLRVTPQTFEYILKLIEDNPVFRSSSPKAQAPVESQLAVTLYRMGRYGNAASVRDIARDAGVSEGTVEAYTARCFKAILDHQSTFCCKPTPAEIEMEKAWVEREIGVPEWQEGWIMYDGTIVVLFCKPGLHGDTYFTRKMNYGLNVQIGNLPSNLRIVDFSHGMTGSAHDAYAFAQTAAGRYPEWLFVGNEFAWADSAYTLTTRVIPVHKKPAALQPRNAKFDGAVAHLRVRSEHCMGALKGRWQSLRGLRVAINSKREHVQACRWITVAIVLHNIVVSQEGSEWSDYYISQYDMSEEPGPPADDDHIPGVLRSVRTGNGEARREELIDALLRERNLDL
jgi:hypothetical protein